MKPVNNPSKFLTSFFLTPNYLNLIEINMFCFFYSRILLSPSCDPINAILLDSVITHAFDAPVIKKKKLYFLIGLNINLPVATYFILSLVSNE